MNLSYLQKSIISLIDRIHQPFSQLMPALTFRYAACGGANTALDIFLYFITYNFILKKQLLDLGFVAISAHIAAFMIVFPITFATGFLLAKYITFSQSELKGRTQLMRYALSVGGSIILNYVLLKFFVERCHIYPTPSKIITTLLVIIYSYIIQKHFTFKMGANKQ